MNGTRGVFALALALAPLAGPQAPARGAAPEAITVTSARGTLRVPVALDRGFPALAVAPLGEVLALEILASPPGTASLGVSGRVFTFVLDAAYFRYLGTVYALAAGPYVARDSLFVPLQFFAEHLPRLIARYRYDAARGLFEELPEAAADQVQRVVVTPSAPAVRPAVPAVRRPRVVAIDPGHGGVDVGMTGPIGSEHFLREKDITLGIARELARELPNQGLTGVLTRDADTLIALGDRGAIAARAGATIFVSIHVNAAPPSWGRAARTARGFETYYLAEARTEDAQRVQRMENSSVRFETAARAGHGDPMGFILRDLAQNEHLRESSRLAELVQESLGKVHPSESRGVKQAGFMVLATSYMPAILIETGFGSNDAEARYLASPAGQRRLARAIAEGIGRYMAELERRLAAGNSR
ncbi:MAG: N-acetylmuramoyl-L-alanine amidase [Gemmatimonadales bacterium]